MLNNRVDINKTSSLETNELFVNQLIQKLQPYYNEIYETLGPFCDDEE